MLKIHFNMAFFSVCLLEHLKSLLEEVESILEEMKNILEDV